MKRTLTGILAISGLALTLLPSMLVFSGAISTQTNKWLMGIGMVLWFTMAPFWIRRAR
ncbi:MAG: hypothetical protein KDD06_04885 [Phaeodactylibacter sp.]|nr:hypothetical protein [Phaeodactylibacter sp.]MCB9263669.1 hypothetical protein [Lewinellaceae bacterium]MCB9286924.1 hypothetical protein [Lewinellaceae bacterium]